MIIVTTNDLSRYEVEEVPILAFRYDSYELGSIWTEICAYGTAVKARKL